MKKHEFTAQSLPKLVIKYIVPSIFGMLFISMQTIIDGVFVGNYVGENALASINIVLPLIQFVTAISMVIGVGAQSLIAIRLGEKQQKQAQNTFRTALLGAFIISALITAIGLLFATPIARVLGASDLLIKDSSDYLFTVSFFVMPIALWFLFDFSARVLRKPALCFFAMLISAGTNILLDYLLVGVAGMGIKGAAIATGVAYSLACLICSIPFFFKKSPINLYQGAFQIKLFGQMCYNGSSEGVNMLSSAVVIMVFNLMLMQYAGESGVAAYTAIMYVMQVGFSVLMGISDGLRPIISYNYGAHGVKRLKRIILLECILGLVSGIIIFTVMMVFGRNLIALFVKSEAVIALTLNGVQIVAFSFLMNGFNILASGYYTAINFAKESILIAALRGLVFMLLFVFTLPLFLQINGIWLTMVCTEAATLVVVCILFIRHYRSQKLLLYPDSAGDVKHENPADSSV